MKINDISSVPRRGALLMIPEYELPALRSLASRVKKVGEVSWIAESPAEAAAWLALLWHYNASLDKERIPSEWLGFPENKLLSFRGQPAQYSSLTPSRWRLQEQQRHLHENALNWLHLGSQLLIDSGFRWVNPRSSPFFIDRRDSEAIAQHYGIGTHLIDWTWDPFVALAFAIQASKKSKSCDKSALIAIRTISKESNDQLILPPTFAQRVWKQAGLFQWHHCPSEELNSPSLTSLGIQHHGAARSTLECYPRIKFPVDSDATDWADSRYNEIMSDDSPFKALARWAISSSKLFSFARNTPDIEQHFDSQGMAMASALEVVVQPIHEDLTVVEPYAEKVALRSRGGEIGVDEGALAIFCEGVGQGCSICWSDTNEPSGESKWVGRFLRDPSYARTLRQRIGGARLLKRRMDGNVGFWIQDEWQGIDLFRPLDS